MADRREGRAPYNFVPFSEKILFPYSDPSELPGHDTLREDLKSGEIWVKLRAETPVFVSDGDPDGRKEFHFFRGANGRYMIPGSTVRGMARENMQILGFGLVQPGEDLDNYQIYFREIAAAKGSAGEALKRYYTSALRIKKWKNPRTGRFVSTPQAVASGYLCCRQEHYFIRPTSGPFLRVSRGHPDVRQFGMENARTVPVAYRAEGRTVKQIAPPDERKLHGMQRGVLLYTGRPVGRAPNHLYLFPAEDINAAEIPVSPEDILSYQVDLESRRNSLKAYHSVHFWALPGEGERKPVFFAQHDGHLYFGMSLFLRIGYRYPLSTGLPRPHRERIGQEQLPLDYPHAILGFATETASYRSRVSFGDFTAVGDPQEQAEAHVILVSPRPSYYPGYVAGGKTYNDLDPNSEEDRDRFQLRGYKQYWLKPVQSSSVPGGKETVKTVIRPLPAGTEFQGVVRFRNLTDLELGLLLWSLRLEEGCCQTIGMGKPYGYGRMRAQIETLQVLDWRRLYSGALTDSPWRDETGCVEQYIAAYESGALDANEKETVHIRDQEEIQDFFFIKRSVRNESQASYMALTEYKDVQGPLPSIRNIRKGERTASAEPISDSAGRHETP